MPEFKLEVEIEGKATSYYVALPLHHMAELAEEIEDTEARNVAFALLHECKRLQAELDKAQ